MHTQNIKVTRRRTPPGACVEFVGKEGQTIEVELRGEDFANMTDEDIIRHAKAAMDSIAATPSE
jgi:hypothetical protein